MSNICITGASGFLGSNLNKFIKKKKNFKIFPVSVNTKSKKKFFNLNKKLDRKKLFLFLLKKKINIFIHFSWQGIHDPTNVIYLKKNMTDFKNLINICNKAKIEKFISIGSIDEYEKKGKLFENSETTKSRKNYYAIGKIKSLKIISKKFNSKYVHLRIPNVYGLKKNNNYLLNKLFILNKKRSKYLLKNLNQQRVYIFIDDLSKAIFNVIKNDFHGVINIGSGKSISVKSFAKAFLNILNKKNSNIKLHEGRKFKNFHFSSKKIKLKNFRIDLEENFKKIIKLKKALKK